MAISAWRFEARSKLQQFCEQSHYRNEEHGCCCGPHGLSSIGRTAPAVGYEGEDLGPWGVVNMDDTQQEKEENPAM